MTIPAVKLIQLIIEVGIPGVRDLIAIWRKGGELTLDEADALVAKYDKRAGDYLVPPPPGGAK